MSRESANRAADEDALLRRLFDNSSDILFLLGPGGHVKLVNDAFLRVVGKTREEVVGFRLGAYFHDDDRPDARTRVYSSKPGVVYEAEIRLLVPNGEPCWYAVRRQLLGDGCHILAMREATAERARRDELEEARRERKLLSASAGIGMWTYEPFDDRIWWSDELAGIAGIGPGEIKTPEDFFRLVHPRDVARVRAQCNDAVRTGQTLHLQHRIRSGEGWRILRATIRGEPRATGVWALKGICQDITEVVDARDAARRGELQMRRARREAEALAGRLKVALEAAVAGAYEIDHVKRTFWASPEFERITGCYGASYEAAVALDTPHFHPDDLPHVRESFRALHRGERDSGDTFEARILRPDRSERWIRVHHHLEVARNGRWLRATGLIQDCDVAKRQELALLEAQRAAEAAAEAKASFLANMSHEIRTPLNGVMGVLHLLKNEHLTEDGRALLEEALSCGDMLSELLNDVIDFSKIEAGRLELACEPLEPRALVEGVARLMAPQAQAKGLQLLVDIDPRVGWVVSDPVRLRQALFNLMGNAVKFTEKGHVAVRCRLADPGVLRFEVEDTGVGIPQHAQARLFQRFNQADASTTRRFGGSGLGLAITRRLAEMMGGEVGFRSDEGQGSTFWLQVAAEPAEAQDRAIETEISALDGLRILVVEDNATNRMIATKLLENLGASVETAVDGYLGVEAAAHGGFDLILMDVQMPGIDGLEAARRIRAAGGPSAQIPIVALTANVMSHQRQAYLDAGMDGVVGKPISPAALLSEIARLADVATTEAARVA